MSRYRIYGDSLTAADIARVAYMRVGMKADLISANFPVLRTGSRAPGAISISSRHGALPDVSL